MVFVIPSNAADYEAGQMPTEGDISAMMAFNEELANAGVMLDGQGLHPTARGARISWSGGKPQVTDGPFAETKELIGGYWLWQVGSKEEAIEWARKCPMSDGDQLIMRQLFEMSDFDISRESGIMEQAERIAQIERSNAGAD
jgi:hypothetical protein